MFQGAKVPPMVLSLLGAIVRGNSERKFQLPSISKSLEKGLQYLQYLMELAAKNLMIDFDIQCGA